MNAGRTVILFQVYGAICGRVGRHSGSEDSRQRLPEGLVSEFDSHRRNRPLLPPSENRGRETTHRRDGTQTPLQVFGLRI